MTLDHTLKLDSPALEVDQLILPGSEFQKSIKVTPTLALSPQEFEESRGSNEKLNDFLVRIGGEVFTRDYTEWLSRKNNRRSLELITADCYLALKKIILSYDVTSECSFYSYVRNLLYPKVIDLWREENEGYSRWSSGQAQRVAVADPETLNKFSSDDLDPSIIAEGRDLAEVFLARLPKAHQQIITLRTEGYIFKEMTEKIGKSEWTIYSYLRQIRDEFGKFRESSLKFLGYAEVKQQLKENYLTLDDFQKNKPLARTLKCSNTRIELARAAITAGAYPWEAPESFSLFGKSGGSLYVNPNVMGSQERVNHNIGVGISDRIHTLDDVRQNEALASALKCPKNATAIAAELVRRGIISGIVPNGHPFTIGQTRSNYFDPAVVGARTVRTNVVKFLKENAATLDDLPMIDALCSTLGIERRRLALAKHVVEQGIMDWKIPPFHNIQIAQGSLYLNKLVMTPEKINFNLRIIFNSTFGGNLDNIPLKSKSLSSALAVPNNKGAIVRELLKRQIATLTPPVGYDPRSKRQSAYLMDSAGKTFKTD